MLLLTTAKKAGVAAAVAFAGAIGTALTDGGLTLAEVAVSAAAAIAAGVGVYTATNTPQS